jgi:hypothetical protein
MELVEADADIKVALCNSCGGWIVIACVESQMANKAKNWRVKNTTVKYITTAKSHTLKSCKCERAK